MKSKAWISLMVLIFSLKGFSYEPDFKVVELNTTQLNRIKIFSKAYGLIRHFDPSTQVQEFERWEEFICLGIREMINLENNKQLNQTLNNLFGVISSNNYFSETEKRPDHQIKGEITDSVVYKKNIGWGDKERARARPERFEKFYYTTYEKVLLEDLPPFLKNPLEINAYQLSKNTFLHLPQSHYLKNGRTISTDKGKSIFEIIPIDTFQMTNPEVRIGCIILIWNVMQHFYPYLDVVGINTDEILHQYIDRAAKCESKINFLKLLQNFCHEYRDNHAIVIESSEDAWEQYMPPIKVEEIAKTIRVVWIKPDFNTKMKIGDEIVTVNDIPINTFFSEKYTHYSGATDRYLRFVTCWHLLEGNEGDLIKVGFKGNNEEVIQEVIPLTLNLWDFKDYPQNDLAYEEYKPGYYYLNLSRVKNDTLSYLMDFKLPFAKGIILDLRNSYYLERGKELLGHFSLDTLFAPPMTVPAYYFPNQENKNVEKVAVDTKNWKIPPQLPKYTSNVAFIFDHQMYSGRETEAAIIAHFKLGITVGRSTGGTNGNTSIVKLFDSYQLFFSGMEVFQFDTTTFHGVGIRPTIEVEQTLEDLYKGKDTFIEKAKSVLE